MKKFVLISSIILGMFSAKADNVNLHFMADTVKKDTAKKLATADTVKVIVVKHDTIAMPANQMAHILNMMRLKRNDAEKVKILKTCLKGKGVTIEQLKTLLNQFLKDDSKLDCAIYAYPSTVDYMGFADIENLFSTQDPKDKLADFLKHNK